MSHMVIYRGSDGKPGYHQTDDIHDAVGFVEQMRNDQGVEHARIFRLEEVVFQYKPYYRVELADGGRAEVDSGSDGADESDLKELASANGSDESPSTNGSNTKADKADNGTAKPPSKDGTKATDSVPHPATKVTSAASAGDDAAGKKGLFGR